MTTEALRHQKNSTESAAPLSWNASSIKYRIARAMCYGSTANECLITTPAAVELGKQDIQSRLSFVCQLVYNSAHLIFFPHHYTSFLHGNILQQYPLQWNLFTKVYKNLCVLNHVFIQRAIKTPEIRLSIKSIKRNFHFS